MAGIEARSTGSHSPVRDSVAVAGLRSETASERKMRKILARSCVPQCVDHRPRGVHRVLDERAPGRPQLVPSPRIPARASALLPVDEPLQVGQTATFPFPADRWAGLVRDLDLQLGNPGPQFVDVLLCATDAAAGRMTAVDVRRDPSVIEGRIPLAKCRLSGEHTGHRARHQCRLNEEWDRVLA